MLPSKKEIESLKHDFLVLDMHKDKSVRFRILEALAIRFYQIGYKTAVLQCKNALSEQLKDERNYF